MQLEDEFKHKNSKKCSDSSLDNSSAVSDRHLKDKNKSIPLLVNMGKDNNAIMSDTSHEKQKLNKVKEKTAGADTFGKKPFNPMGKPNISNKTPYLNALEDFL